MLENVYVVTGATSFIASGLLRELIRRQGKIYAVCRPNSEKMFRIPKSDKIHIIECELENLDRLREKIKQPCHVFFHLGWDGTGDKNNMYLQNQNVKYTLDAVQAAAQLGCHTFIGAGSQAEYGLANTKLHENTPTFPVNGYGMGKLSAGLMSRKACEQLGIKHIWSRILSVYGPMDAQGTLVMSMIKKLTNGEKPMLTKAEQIWDFLYIDDCAKALYLLSEHGQASQVYNIGSGEEIQLKEYAEKIRGIVNPKIDIEYGAKAYNENTPMFLSANIEKLKKDTGFEPKVSFETGIHQIIENLKLTNRP
ncbi:MAG: NAD(P)-dependent oxidoreductase [Oscillospiraceae bacterium]